VTAPLTRTEFDRVDELLRRASNMRPALRHPLINTTAHFRRMADALAEIGSCMLRARRTANVKEFYELVWEADAIARDALPEGWERK
jgi:hypothetical protein